MSKNKITAVTRRNIADSLTEERLWYHGRLKEADFLNRLYDLSSMPSTDYRPEYNNAYKDIHQHADMNMGDWPPGWVFTDVRLNLMHGDDDVYLRFLNETLGPHIRSDNDAADKLVDIITSIYSQRDLNFIMQMKYRVGPYLNGQEKIQGRRN